MCIAPLLDNLPVYAFIKDKAGTILLANQKLCDSFRMPRGEIVGKNVFDLLPGDLAEKYRSDDETVLSTGRPLITEEDFVEKGKRIRVETHKVPLRDESGAIVGILGLGFNVSRRKQAEAALARSEERYRRLIEEINDIVWELDADGSFIYLSPKIYDVLGYWSEDMLGKRPFDLMTPEDAERASNDYFACIECIEPATNFVYAHRHKDGRIKYLEVAGMPVLDQNGAVTGFRGVTRDVTDHKNFEDALHESEEKFRVLAESARAGILLFQGEKTVYANKALADMSGYTTDECMSMKFWDMVHPDDREMVRNRGLGRQRGEDVPSRYEFKMSRKDGEMRWLDCSVGLLSYKGRPAVIAAVLDVTERKEVEHALKKSEQFLESVFDCIQDGISVLDKDLNIIRANPVIEQWHQYMMPIVGKKCYYVYHWRSSPCEVCPSLSAMREKSMQKAIVPFTGETGQRGWLEIYAFPLFDDRGEISGVVEHVRDITERVRAEESLKAAKAETELYVDLMGHDISNLNQISLGFLELAQNIVMYEGKLDATNLFLLDKAIESLQNSSKLIDNVRKLQREKMGLYAPQVLDVGKIILEVVAQFQQVPNREVKISHTSAGACHVRANELLKDVFVNLIGNAIKHSTGPLKVDIRGGKVREDGQEYCRIAVEDNGPGMPDSLKRTLFSRLNLDNTRAKGKGFGLCLIKLLIDDYDGRFWVEDRVQGDHKKGCRFVVMLPAVKHEE